jgi:Tfp pilus assembly protein PilF
MWIQVAALLFWQAVNPGADGLKALNEGRYEAAAQAFTKAIANDPSDYSAHFNLALADSFLKNDDAAIMEYRKTLELKPGLYEAQLNLGIVLLRQKKPADALPLLSAAAAQKPSEYRPRYYLAEAELGTGAAVKAEEDYRMAIALNSKSAGAQLGLGRTLAQEGKLTEAAPYFRQAAELDPNYRDSLLELAGLYEKSGKNTEAIEIYRQFPENPAAAEHLGSLLLDTKQYAEAIPGLEDAYAKSPTEANRVALAMAYLFNHDLEKSLPLLDQAVTAEPTNFDLRIMYAHALRDQKKYEAASGQFTVALKLKPDDTHTWDELGTVLYMAEDYQPALAAFERAHQLGENTAGNWFLRAIILDRFHQLKPAVEAYQQFLSMSHEKNPDQEFQARQRIRLLQRELDRR